jgi:hypothetical protein
MPTMPLVSGTLVKGVVLLREALNGAESYEYLTVERVAIIFFCFLLSFSLL